MIRVNLLARRRRTEAREAGGQLWLVAVLVLFLVEVAGLSVFHGVKAEELSVQQRKNDELRAQIDAAKKAVANHQGIKAQLEELREQEDAIAKLQSARTGPTAVLLELARILTPGRGPSISPERLSQVRRDNPLAAYNPSWDARRLWLLRFDEDRRKVRLQGVARDGEDVSELARRMNLSSYFDAVKLLPAKQQADKETGLDLVSFELEAQARY
jgi:type IV pilus assembly protein PilN